MPAVGLEMLAAWLTRFLKPLQTKLRIVQILFRDAGASFGSEAKFGRHIRHRYSKSKICRADVRQGSMSAADTCCKPLVIPLNVFNSLRYTWRMQKCIENLWAASDAKLSDNINSKCRTVSPFEI